MRHTLRNRRSANKIWRTAFKSVPLMLVGASVVFAMLCGSPARAEYLARDNFDYPTGELDGKSGGVGSWGSAWDNFDNKF